MATTTPFADTCIFTCNNTEEATPILFQLLQQQVCLRFAVPFFAHVGNFILLPAQESTPSDDNSESSATCLLWKTFFKTMYSKCKLSHFVYQSLLYYPHTNVYGQREVQLEHDPEVKCMDMGVGEELYCPLKRKPVQNAASVKYVITGSDMFGIKEENSSNAVQFYGHYMFRHVKRLVLLNKNGVNDDHRGMDHTTIRVPMEPIVQILSPVTVQDVVDAAFRVRSHKFENWYEMFINVRNVQWEQESGTLTILLVFDHGS